MAAIIVPILSKWDAKGVDAASKDIKGAEGVWNKASAGIQSALHPAIAAFSAVSGFIFKTGQAASEAAVEEKKLAHIMASMGFSKNTKAVSAYADELSALIGVDDEVIRSAQSQLATFSNVARSTEVMGRATKAAADLAAAGFGTMDSASIMLGKALQDPTKGITALTRVGISFTKQQQKQLEAMQATGDIAGAQALILKEVERQVGGTAAATATGMAKFKTAMGEFMESVGTALVPLFERLADLLLKVGTFLVKNADAVAKLAVVILKASSAIIAMNLALKAVNTVMGFAKIVTNAWAIVIIALVVVVLKAYQSSEQFRAVVQQLAVVLKAIASAVVPILIMVLEMLLAKITRLASFVRDVWGPVFKQVFAAVLSVVQRVMPIVIVLITAALNIITRLATFLKTALGPAVQQVFGALRQVAQAVLPLVIALLNGMLKAASKIATFLRATFGPIAKQVFNQLLAVVQKVMPVVVRLIEPLLKILQRVLDLVAKIISKIGEMVSKIPFIGGKMSGLESAAGRSAPGVSTQATRSSVVINVNGALDPERVARQIRGLLNDHDARQGRIVVKAPAW